MRSPVARCACPAPRGCVCRGATCRLVTLHGPAKLRPGISHPPRRINTCVRTGQGRGSVYASVLSTRRCHTNSTEVTYMRNSSSHPHPGCYVIAESRTGQSSLGITVCIGAPCGAPQLGGGAAICCSAVHDCPCVAAWMCYHAPAQAAGTHMCYHYAGLF